MGDLKATLAEQLVEACRLLHQQGLIAGVDGNIAARTVRGTVLVTPSGVHKGLLSPEDLVEVTLVGETVSSGKPTSELPMHLAILATRPDVQVVVHAHAPTAVAATLAGRSINDVLPELTIALGNVPTVPYTRPGTEELARRVATALMSAKAVVVERHGTVSVGRSVTEALARTEMVEHAAKILWMASLLKRPRPLEEGELRVLARLAP